MNEFDILSGFNNVDILKNAPEERVKKDYKDTRFWKLSRDKNGDGEAVIRLLTDKNKIPYVRIYHYSSQKTIGDKKFYLIANSPDSIGMPCPIKEYYFELANQGLQDEAKMYSRKVKYYTNIYVEKDPSNPENEGKVFLWEFGQKLLDKFTDWMKGDSDMGEKGKELYNPLTGNSIKLVINKNQNSGFFEYDRTKVFPNTSPVGGIDDKNKIVDILLNQTYDLNEFKSPEYFESYDELKEKLDFFINPLKKSKSVSEVTTTPSLNIIEETYSSPMKKEDKVEEEIPDWIGGDDKDKVVEEKPQEKKEEKKEENKGNNDWLDDVEGLFS